MEKPTNYTPETIKLSLGVHPLGDAKENRKPTRAHAKDATKLSVNLYFVTDSSYSSFAGTAIRVSTLYCVEKPVSITNFMASLSSGTSKIIIPS